MEDASSNGGAAASASPVLQQPNGGWLRPWQPGQSGNPAGKLSKQAQVAREIANRIGLAGVLELARRYKPRSGEFADALLNTACDTEAKGQVAAGKLVHELLGTLIKREEVQHQHSLEVQVLRQKIRDMGDDEPREVHLEQPNGNGHDEEEGEPRPAK